MSGSNLNKTKKIAHSFDEMEHMSADLKECVHEFGYAIVDACRTVGIEQPRHIRHLVHVIWDGARQPLQRRPLSTLDWLLLQAGAEISGARLIGYLAAHGFLVVPREPNIKMVEASMDAVHHMGRVTKTEKHRNRLRAALKVGAAKLSGSGGPVVAGVAAGRWEPVR